VGELQNLPRVRSDVADGGVDLSERDAHATDCSGTIAAASRRGTGRL
jgi:hypothetical protein